MNKIWYKLVFKPITPLHIGKFNYGVLSETRVFIPGWTMWGAIVNYYGQSKGGKDKDFEEGKEIFETITCFFPMQKNKKEDVLFPKYKNGRYHFGEYTEDLLRVGITDVNISTSIQPDFLSAKEESLHETEVILPKSKNKNQLYWVGLLALNEDKIKDVKSFLKEGIEVVVGGDNRYGFGKLVLYSELVKAESRDLEEWNMDFKGIPVLNKSLRNYAIPLEDYIIEGKIEHVITEFDFSEVTPKIKENKIAIVPGGKLKSKDNSGSKLKLKLIKGIFDYKDFRGLL